MPQSSTALTNCESTKTVSNKLHAKYDSADTSRRAFINPLEYGLLFPILTIKSILQCDVVWTRKFVPSGAETSRKELHIKMLLSFTVLGLNFDCSKYIEGAT